MMARPKIFLKLEPLSDKWKSFGWNTLSIDGHDIDQIEGAFMTAKKTKGVPTMIIANTIKGNGASYMLDKPGFHYTPPTKEQMEQAIAELGY